MKIMIVEDNPKMRRLIRYALNEGHNTVVDCAGGADALQVFGTYRPDLVLMDLQMPGMDGLAATRMLRERYSDARIHILSDYDEDEIRRAAAAAGASGYTSKTNLDELESIVRQYSGQGKWPGRAGTEPA